MCESTVTQAFPAERDCGLDDVELVCHSCGKTFKPGSDEEGLPNGVGFVLDNGDIYCVCRECIIKYGEEHDDGAGQADSGTAQGDKKTEG